MRAADGELIPPGDFLPAAEKYGAIRDIDRWVIAQAADIAARGIDVEINISAASIGDPGLIADIEQELARTGADPSRLVFEITETALIAETEVAVTLAERLRAARLPLRPRRLRQRLRRLPLPQAPADGLPQDRSRVHPGRAHERRRPARDPRDRRARARASACRRSPRAWRTRRRWICCVRSASTTPRASTSAGPPHWRWKGRARRGRAASLPMR